MKTWLQLGSHGLAPGWPGEAWWVPTACEAARERESGRDPVHEKTPVFEGLNGI